MNHIIADPRIRKYVYGIIAAAIPILVVVGVITEDDMQLWLTLAAAVLGFGSAGLAAPNTPDVKRKGSGDLAPDPIEDGPDRRDEHGI